MNARNTCTAHTVAAMCTFVWWVLAKLRRHMPEPWQHLGAAVAVLVLPFNTVICAYDVIEGRRNKQETSVVIARIPVINTLRRPCIPSPRVCPSQPTNRVISYP
ncbi:hypothetical protein C8Q73DRAFT_507791 [Cubamyces lactineus]|nr:hypothetical protein C8Q73DRAFT_507791 [Cubamyces lactineus]